MAILKRIFVRIAAPTIDFAVILACFYAVTLAWQQIKFHGEASYPMEFIVYVLPIYSLLMLFSLYYTGFLFEQASLARLIQRIRFGQFAYFEHVCFA